MNHDDVKEGAHRFFHREYETGFRNFCKECDDPEWHGRPDLVFVQSRRDVIQVVEARRLAEEVDDGLHQLDRYPGNYRWLALPADEYYSAEYGIASSCSRRGYGLLLVSGEERYRAEVNGGSTETSCRTIRGRRASGSAVDPRLMFRTSSQPRRARRRWRENVGSFELAAADGPRTPRDRATSPRTGNP